MYTTQRRDDIWGGERVKTCTECGGEIEDSSLHNFHYVISTCVKNLQARVEKSEAEAVEFAKLVWDQSNILRRDGWSIGLHEDSYKILDEMVRLGYLEKHPENQWYRWAASKQQ